MPKPCSDRTGGGAHFNMSLAAVDERREPVRARRGRRPARRGRLAARLPVHRRRPRPRARDHGGHLPDRELVQAPDHDRRDDRLHVGAGVHLVRAQQPHAHAAGADEVARASSRARSTPRSTPTSARRWCSAAGLEGIEHELDPGDPIDRDMYVQSDEQLAELGVELLPRTLSEAVEAFEADPLTLRGVRPRAHAGLHRLQERGVGGLPQHRLSGSTTAT